MILSKEDRTKLQQIIHSELQKNEHPSPKKNLLLIISALIADFEELESILSEMYSIFASGKEIVEMLDSLSGILTADVTDKLQLEGETKLIQNLLSLASSAQNLKCILSFLHHKGSIVQ